MDLTFRKATVADAEFISRGFHTAMLYDDADDQHIRDFAQVVCTRDDVLYSARNTMIAIIDGRPIGMVTAYDGAGYRSMRAVTMSIIKESFGTEFPNMEDETRAGEYYIDSLAVLPEYRGLGVGRALLQRAIDQGRESGLTVVIAVDPVNDKAQRLYQSMGFKMAGSLFIFGHDYWRMAIEA